MGKTIKLKNDIYLANDLYSTTEKIIGKWINDKPIYRRTFKFNIAITIPPNTWVNLIDRGQIEEITDAKIQSTNNMIWTSYMISASGGKIVIFNTGTDWFVKTMTLEYTKI